MELGHVELAQIEFTFERFRKIIQVSLTEAIGYWATMTPIEVPYEVAQRYRGLDFYDVLAHAIWHDRYAAKVYSKSTPSLMLGEISMPSVKNALTIMSKDYNEYFQHLIQQPQPIDVDCDVFFQLAAMGGLRFG